METIEGIVKELFRREFGKKLIDSPIVACEPSKLFSARVNHHMVRSPILSTHGPPVCSKGDILDKSDKSNKESLMGSFMFTN